MKNRSAIFLILILILSTAIYAETLRVNEGNSVNQSGKVITVQSLKADRVVMDINGINGVIYNNGTEIINGVEIDIVEIFLGFNPDFVDLTISVLAICGDNSCNLAYETNSTCCTDCGCENNATDICIENSCIAKELNECLSHEECDDNDTLTIDLCVGAPRKCSNELDTCDETDLCDDNNTETLDECVNNLCRFTLYEDLAECSIDQDCDDKNDKTIDKCEGLPKECSHTEKKEPSKAQQKTDAEGEEQKETLKDQKGFFRKVWYIIVKIFTF